MLYQRSLIESFQETPFDESKTEVLSSRSKTRESMKSLPAWMQPFLTWLTAVPLLNQKRSNHSAAYHLIGSLLTLGFGFVLGKVGLEGSLGLIMSILFCALGACCSLSAMRKLQVVIVHHCSHSNFFSRKSPWNRRLGSVLSFALFTEPFHSYQLAHIQDHHFTEHMTERDPTVKFLFERLGLRPGMTVKESTRRILLSFISPGFYWGAFKQRVKEQRQASDLYQIGLLFFWCVLTGAALVHEAFPLLAISYVIPLFILYPVSSALRLVVEHTFPQCEASRGFDLASHSYLTNAVFCGEEYPEDALSRLIWFVRLFLIHLPARFLILVGDTPVHDHHHRHPLYADWPNYAYARNSEINLAKPGYSPYREVWGYTNAFQHSLKSLENQRRGN